jgi:nitroimidazol reductase NimA-like FMN-containing flavoprotein (pyridoxamine 5'-phosphate oxidase superfamily)
MATRARQSSTSALRSLSPRECAALLARHHVGRIAFAHRGHVSIAPLLYVYVDGWLYARADAAVRTAIRHNRWVAVEVAEVDSPSDWRSVVARGACYSASARGAAAESTIADGIARLRREVPTLSRSESGAPFRTAIYRVHVDELSGIRASAPGPAAATN